MRLPFYQGALDSLCGVYSIVNAERMINRSSFEESQVLFDEIVCFLSRKRLLTDVLIEGMLLKHMTRILDDVVGDFIPGRDLPWRGVPNPSLDDFWRSVTDFLDGTPGRAVILGLNGVNDHWTVIESISERQINLHDSDSLKRLPRAYCTTSDQRGKRQHILAPAQTYFLSDGG